MSILKPFIVTLALAACTGGGGPLTEGGQSEDENGSGDGDGVLPGTSSSNRVQASCERLAQLCSQGNATDACASSQASYDKLSATEKARADAMIDCITRASSCEAATTCTRLSGGS